MGGAQNSCDIQFDFQAPNSSHVNTCNTYYYDGNAEGSNNQDLRNLSCQLAWYIFQNYSVQNRNVWIIAHSMGGLLVRDALFQVESHNPAYPPFLYVPGVVTFATPHGGITLGGAAGFLCGGCVQASNMQTNGSPPCNSIPSPPVCFISTLLTETNAPMGSPGEPTEWTDMGSSGESWLNGGVDPSSSLALPPSRPGYPAVHKIEYTNVPGQSNNPYHHGDYLFDTDGNLDATANVCDNCSFPRGSATVYHSLRQAFQNIAHPAPPVPAFLVINFVSRGSYFDKWLTMTGVDGPLGDPTNAASNVGSGQSQNFQGGGIYWSSGGGTDEVQGVIYQKYISPAIGGPTGKLGFPVTDEQPIANGRVSYFAGQSCNGGGPNGSGSAIYFNGNAFEVQGCIYNKYQQGIPDQSGGSGPTSKFGFPVTDEQDIAGGKVSYFAGTSCNGGGPNNSGSAIYFNGTAIEVHGCIYHEYATVMGGPSQAGGLGFPTTDEKTIGGGYVSYFAGTGCNSGGPTGTGSAIYSISGLGTHTVKGCIYQEYVQNLGGPTHEYGFPTSEEMPFNGGKVSYFTGTGCTSGSWQGTGSAIMFGAGTFGVKGCIYQMYQQYISDTGNPLSTDLGLPTSEESPTFSGAPGSTLTAKVSIFQHGAIYFYTNAVGEYEVQGNIYNAYFSAGAEFSNCGLPTSNEYIVPNTSPQQRASNFENGIITYIPGVGTQINC